MIDSERTYERVRLASSAVITPNGLFLLKEALWPHVRFSRKQVEIVESVALDLSTVVPAGNKLGKDFVAGFLVAACSTICAAKNIQFKIVTSSATKEHLDNLWGEIDYFISSSRMPLTTQRGGKLVYLPLGQRIGIMGESLYDGSPEHKTNSYVVSRVITNENKGEGLQGHHAPWNLWVADEASGMSDTAHRMAKTWAKHMLVIGNCWPTVNFFYRAVKGDPSTNDPGGDLAA